MVQGGAMEQLCICRFKKVQYILDLIWNEFFLKVSNTVRITALPAGFQGVLCGHVAVQACEFAAVIFSPGLRTASCGDGPELAVFFGLPPDHSKLGLITKTSIPVWSWSHSVRTLMRNMWSCPDTQSEETQSLTPSFSPPFHLPSPLSPILSCSLSFAPFSTVSVPVFFSYCSTTIRSSVLVCVSVRYYCLLFFRFYFFSRLLFIFLDFLCVHCKLLL